MKPAHHTRDITGLRTVLRGRPPQQDNRNAGSTGSKNLGVGGASSRIFGDEKFDALILQQSGFFGLAKWSARENEAVRNCTAGEGVETVRPIDGADEIEMLRRFGECRQIEAAMGQENAPGRLGECGNRLLDRVHFCPEILLLTLPCRTRQLNQRNLRRGTGNHSVSRHLCGEGVGRIDDAGDVFLCEVAEQPGNATKAATAKRHGLHRRLGSPGKRQGKAPRLPSALVVQAFGKLARLKSAAQNKDMMWLQRTYP